MGQNPRFTRKETKRASVDPEGKVTCSGSHCDLWCGSAYLCPPPGPLTPGLPSLPPPSCMWPAASHLSLWGRWSGWGQGDSARSYFQVSLHWACPLSTSWSPTSFLILGPRDGGQATVCLPWWWALGEMRRYLLDIGGWAGQAGARIGMWGLH